MERLTLDDMIKALRCVASQDREGDCYADHENFMHMEDDENKRIVCETGEDLRDYISGKEAVGCPYHQSTYGCCFEDGESYWLKDVAELLEELKSYKEAEEQGLLVRLPCKVGDTVYVKLSACYKFKYTEAQVRDYTHFISCGFCVVVTSTEFDKLAIPFSEFGKTIFLTREEAEKKLEEIQNDKT